MVIVYNVMLACEQYCSLIHSQVHNDVAVLHCRGHGLPVISIVYIVIVIAIVIVIVIVIVIDIAIVIIIVIVIVIVIILKSTVM